MAKEWVLNNATNRFQFNFKRNVGPTSESIRKCAPKSIEEWEEYYYMNVRSKDHIEDLGRRLYVKITEVIDAEIKQISEQDCIDYIKNLVIKRTYDGYQTEICTIYEQINTILNVEFIPASDEWDRKYNVDFFLEINSKFIGLQIKPVSEGIQLNQIFKERNIQLETHRAFTKKFGGKVFYIYSLGKKGKKDIVNKEVLDEIKAEIERLNK